MQTQLSELIRVLTSREPLPPLLPRQIWQPELSTQISSLSDNQLFSEMELSPSQKLNARAGLLIWNDDIDAAHELVQDGHDATECFWHTIIHRREGDFSNANYWCNRIGTHSTFTTLRRVVVEELKNCDDVEAEFFRDSIEAWQLWQPRLLVQAVEGEKQQESEWIRRVQAAEMRVLLSWCLGENV